MADGIYHKLRDPDSKSTASTLSYYGQLCAAMEMLACDSRVVFMGQAVEDRGTAMTGTFPRLGGGRLLELPVAEDMQLGMAIGMSLAGLIPVCVYPRFNFLGLAWSQLVLHLDKLPLYSDYRPKVIIRTAVATPRPLDPGPQHLGDFTEPFRMMLETIHVVRLYRSDVILPAYEQALESSGSTLLVELSELSRHD